MARTTGLFRRPLGTSPLVLLAAITVLASASVAHALVSPAALLTGGDDGDASPWEAGMPDGALTEMATDNWWEQLADRFQHDPSLKAAADEEELDGRLREAFSFKDCSSPAQASVVRVKGLQASPDPLVIGEMATITVNLSRPFAPIPAPIPASIVLEKKIFGQWRLLVNKAVPDLCAKLPTPGGQGPHCPIPPSAETQLTFHHLIQVPPKVPSQLVTGQFRMHVNASGVVPGHGKFALCMVVTLAVRAP